MPQLQANGLPHYYEQVGEGVPLVFIHGAFVDAQIWDPQWQYFSSRFGLLRYDLRGHGKTGPSNLDQDSIDTYTDDLSSILSSLGIDSPILCGLSWGGSIALAYTAKYPQQVRALALASPSVSIRLTLLDRFLCDFLFPEWAMQSAIRLLNAKNFTRFSWWLARLTRGKNWLGQNPDVQTYLENCMLAISESEYKKIWQAIYAFNLPPLENITCPTLVLNGKNEPENTYQHTKMVLSRVPQSIAKVVPGVSHAINMDAPEVFNKFLLAFLVNLKL